MMLIALRARFRSVRGNDAGVSLVEMTVTMVVLASLVTMLVLMAVVSTVITTPALRRWLRVEPVAEILGSDLLARRPGPVKTGGEVLRGEPVAVGVVAVVGRIDDRVEAAAAAAAAGGMGGMGF